MKATIGCLRICLLILAVSLTARELAAQIVDVPVNDRYPYPQTEPSVAVELAANSANTVRILVAANSNSGEGVVVFAGSYNQSQDITPPQFADQPVALTDNAKSDPSVAFGSNHTAYVACLTYSNTVNLYKSTDADMTTWTLAATIPNHTGMDKPYMTVGKNPDGVESIYGTESFL